MRHMIVKTQFMKQYCVIGMIELKQVLQGPGPLLYRCLDFMDLNRGNVDGRGAFPGE